MPGLTGMDVVRELGQRSPDSAVVMITGYPTVGRATEAMKHGAMDYVAKPFTPDEIAETVKRAVGRKVSEEQKALGRFEKILKTWQFPVPSMEDKAPQTIAETVAQAVGVKKATSPWLSIFVLGILFSAEYFTGALPAGPARDALAYLSTTRHILDFASGFVDTRPVVLYLSGTVFALFAAARAVESERWR